MSEQSITNKTWRPRWYYIMQNKTSGMKYLGQTVRIDMSKYCGSGSYWVPHCKAHGGYNRKNIDVLTQVWFDSKEKANHWLNDFYQQNKNIVDDDGWANECFESTSDTPFSFLTKEKRKIYASLGGKVTGPKQGKRNVESGLLSRYRKIAGQITGAANAKNGSMSKIGKQYGHIQGLANVQSGRLAEISKIGANTVRQMKIYCKEHGIKSPGKGFCKLNKDDFYKWMNQETKLKEQE